MADSTQKLGLRVDLSGHQQAAQGLRELDRAVDQVGRSTRDGAKSAQDSTRAQREASSATQQHAQSLRNQAQQLNAAAAAAQAHAHNLRSAAAAQAAQMQGLGGQMASLQRGTTALQGAAEGVSSALSRWLVPAAFIGSITAAGTALVRARLEVEKLESRQLFANRGNIEAAARDIEFVRERANTLGVDLLVTANSWGRFNAAAAGTALAGNQARDVFDAILQASVAMRMSADETEGALRAVQQMLSKGSVQAEELRGQLGERLPGAFSIAARAMGVTERELNKLLETGQVVAADFLPRFAEQLKRDLGDTPQQAAQGTQAALTLLSNAWQNFKQELSRMDGPDAALSHTTVLLNNMANAIAVARDNGSGLVRQLHEAANAALRFRQTGGMAEAPADRLRQAQQHVAQAEERIRQLESQREQALARGLDASTRARVDALIEGKRRELAAFVSGNQALQAERQRAFDEYRRSEAQSANAARTAAAAQAETTAAAFDKIAAASSTALDKARAAQQQAAGVWQSALKAAEDAIKAGVPGAAAERDRILAEGQRVMRLHEKAIADAQLAEARRGHAAVRSADQEHLQLREQQRQGELIQIRAAAADTLGTLEDLHRAQLVSETEFVRRRAAIEQQRIDDEIAQEQRALAEVVQASRLKGAALALEEQKSANRISRLRGERAANERRMIEGLARVEQKALSERERAQRDYQRALDALTEQRVEAGRATQELNREYALELELMRMNAVQAAIAREHRSIQIQQLKALERAERAYDAARAAARDDGELAAARREYERLTGAINAAADEQRQLAGQVARTGHAFAEGQRLAGEFFDALRNGWQGLRDFVKRVFWDWLKQQFMQRFTLNLGLHLNATGGASGGGLGNLLGGLLGGGQGGGQGVLGGLLGNASSLWSALSGGLNATLASGIGALGSAFGSSALSAFASGLSGSSLAGSMVGPSLYGGTAASLGAGLAGILPWVGGAVALFSIARRLIGKNRDGTWFDFGQSGHSAAEREARNEPHNAWRDAFGTVIKIQGEGELRDMPGFAEAWQQMTQNWVRAFGEQLAAQARGQIGDWTGFSDRGRGTEWSNSEGYAAALATESRDVMAEYFSRVFSVVDGRIAEQISTWTGTVEELASFINGVIAVQQAINQQAATLEHILGQSVSLGELTALQAEGEALSDTFNRILAAFSATNLIAQALGQDTASAFGALGLASLEARERLIDYAGGLQQLSSGFDYYLQTFFSAEERRSLALEAAQQQLAAGFEQLGLAVPQSREAFRALVASLDLGSEEGARLYAALMRLAPAMAAVTEEAGDAAAALQGYSQAYLEHFFSETERQALRVAEASAEVARVFAQLGLAVPQSREAFRALVESIDTGTVAGVQLRNSLMNVADAFATATSGAQRARVAIGGLFGSGGVGDMVALQGRLLERARAAYELIDDTAEGALEQYTRRLNWAREQAAQFDAQYRAMLAQTGGIGTVQSSAYEAARNDMLADQREWARRLALLASLAAQYGHDYADRLLEVELWREEQRRGARGQTQLLLYIEEEYQRRRNEILNGGVADGLGRLQRTIQDWLNGLLLNEQLTTLTPEERLAEARRQYEEALQGGDSSRMTQAADAYLAEARSMYASGADYTDIFNAVIAQMRAIAGGYSVPVVAAPGATLTGPVPAIAARGGSEAPAVQAAIAQVGATSQAALQSSEEVRQLLGQIVLGIEREGAADRANASDNTATLTAALRDTRWARVTP